LGGKICQFSDDAKLKKTEKKNKKKKKNKLEKLIFSFLFI